MSTLNAQPRGGRPDPGEMIAREKQNLYRDLPNLSEDQKMLVDGIYDEYEQSFKELFEDVMKTRDFQSMRPKMEALGKEKDELMKDILNEEEFVIYSNLMENNRKMRAERQGGEGRGVGGRNMPPQIKVDTIQSNL